LERDAVRARISELLGQILKRDLGPLADSVRAEEVAGWDSLAHMRLLVALEEAYDIQFGVSELVAPADVGELISLIQGLA
jgi:acyl carrier protein